MTSNTPRTDKQIVDETNTLARKFYYAMGYDVDADFKFYTEAVNRHPHETMCWNMACEAQEMLTGTDVRDALDNLEGEGE